MKTFNEHNTRPTTQTIGITNTYVIDSKGKKPAYDSKTSSDRDYIRLVNLTKVFKKVKKFKIKKHAAVNNLSLGINKGECFGLIGVNGAGIKETCYFNVSLYDLNLIIL